MGERSGHVVEGGGGGMCCINPFGLIQLICSLSEFFSFCNFLAKWCIKNVSQNTDVSFKNFQASAHQTLPPFLYKREHGP
jgi:hypothetical protein